MDVLRPDYPPQGKIGAAVPSGLIILWSGLIANIPSGYVICDGNNGTPNLLSRFVRQVPTAATNPGTTGGSDSLTLTTAQLASHYHTYTRYSSTDVNLLASGLKLMRGTSTQNTGSTGSGSSHENRPAYYEAAYIMKT